MRKTLVALSCAAALCSPASAAERFVGKARLPDGRTLVVAEGDHEARSVGSYSLRLYEAGTAPDDTTFFISGIVMPREGTVEEVVVRDADSDGEPEVVVMTRTVGTGGYRSARVFDVSGALIEPLITVDGLPADADVFEVLNERATVRDEVKKRQAARLKK